ncbi:MAG: hypothetical protein AAFX78_12805 [Cyanobacteria bacterium J06638_20]
MVTSKWREISTKAVLGLGILLIAGCGGNNSAQDPTAEQGQNPTTNGTPSQGLTCNAPNYFAEVAADQGQFNLTFGEQSAENTLLRANPISNVQNEDGSHTYGYQDTDSTTYYARFYPNGTCLLQVVGGDNTVILEEAGQMAQPGTSAAPIDSSSAQQPNYFQDGYDSGYTLGYAEGKNFRQFNQGNSPEAAFASTAMSGNEQYDQGYREGFFAGFDEGYNTFITTAPEAN